MSPHLPIVVIDQHAESRTALEQVLRNFGESVDVLASVDNYPDGLRQVELHNPAVVFLEVTSLAKGSAEVEELLAHSPRTSVFIVSDEKSSEWILRLIRSGAVEYLLRPINPVEVAQALQKVGRLSLPKLEEPRHKGKIVAVYNPVGGMGTTTVAVNLAAALAQEKGERVALVDLNLTSGDIACFLDVSPTYTLSSVTSNISRLDASFLMGAMTKHSSGVYVLTEPLEVDETLSITSESISRLLTFLQSVFSWVVLDCSGHLSGCTLSAFGMSDHIFYNLTLSLPSLRSARRYLGAMDREGLSRKKVKVIVNRQSRKDGISSHDAERILGSPVAFTIPNEYDDVTASINKGTPLVLLSPRSPVSRAIRDIGDHLRREARPTTSEGRASWSPA